MEKKAPQIINSNNNYEKTVMWRIIEIAIGLILTITVTVTGWNFTQIVALSDRITSVQSNYMTAREILELCRSMDAKFNAIEQQINMVQQRVIAKADRNEVLSPQIDERTRKIQAQLDEVMKSFGK